MPTDGLTPIQVGNGYPENDSLREENARLKAALAQEKSKAEGMPAQDLQILDLLGRVGTAVVGELNLEKAVQAVTDVATEVTGAQFGAFFYTVVNDADETLMLYTVSGVDRSEFSKFPIPRKTSIFAPTFDGEGIVRSDDILADPRYGKNDPHRGMPAGHLPVRSYLAAPVISRSGNVLGGMFFGHEDAGVFTARSERLLAAITGQAAISIDNARLFQALQRELTERKAAEEALRQSTEQLVLASDFGEVGFWDVDHVNGTMYWDRRCREMFGIFDDRPVMLDDFYATLHPDDIDHTKAAYSLALDPAARAFYDVDYRTIGRDDGKERWISAKGRGVFDENDSCVRSLGTVVDITERKLARIALQELNATLEERIAEALENYRLLSYVVETTDAFIQVADRNFNWLAINKASTDEFERIFGIRPKRGDNMLALLDHMPEHREAVRAVWQRALDGEQFTEIAEFGDPNHDRRFYEMKFNSLFDPEGKPIGAYQFVYDVTERMAAQKRLAEAEEHLRQSQKMEAVGQLTGGIAHDFNNMLAVVMGSIDLLDRRIGASDPRAKRMLDNAAEGAKRAANLTQRLLAFSRQQPLRPERLDANKLVAGMSDLLRHSLGGEIRLETVLAGGLWPVQVDPNQLESVLLNLGVNARDAMPGGGRLTIETQNAHLDVRYATEHLGVPAGQYVMIAVTDTGIGMSPEVMEKAFEPFFTTKEVGKGTGLGLSQVYGFVKQSGGHVKIYSEVAKGTTIKLYLPRDTSEKTNSAADLVQVSPEVAEPEELILVVDDEPSVRQFSVDALIELGYRVLEADGAVQAMRLLAAHPEISLLFTDIAMPDKNGRQLADEARILRPDLKVLYTTGYTRNAVVHNGVVDAGVELIGKPFSVDELATRVRTILDTR